MKRLLLLCCLLCCLLAASSALGQTVPVVMLSDLHFDPFHDPAKLPRLLSAPIEKWDPILAEPDSEHQAERFAQLQSTCNARGVDSSYAVLASSLRGAQQQAANASFVTVTGDLLVHAFACRYKATTQSDDYAAFAEKTTNYVIYRTEAAFPTLPVYIADGNNDSSCGDYRMDLQDRYLKQTSKAILAGLHGTRTSELQQAASDYQAGGNYALTLKTPRKTRLLVLNDIFLSKKYSLCAGKPDAAGATAELAFLERELASARKHHQAVWVMGHIPPGVDIYSTLYSTVSKFENVCTKGKVEMFLGNDRLAETMARYGDVIRIGLFAHTHSDELRLLGAGDTVIPIKLIGSISPVNGNKPSFTLAEADRKTAKLVDYTVFVASNTTGKDTTWTREYGFREKYHEADFSKAAVSDLVGQFQSDKVGRAPASRAYQTYFSPGMLPMLLIVWPEYACALNNLTEATFKACVCKK